jgi:hypothetical protein
MRSNIKKKVHILLENELPLLVENKLISFGYDNYNIDPNIVENVENDNDLVRKRSRDGILPNSVIQKIKKYNII